MKKFIHTLVIFLVVTLVNVSCKKNNNDNVDRPNIHATIRLNETYRLDLGGFGDEEGASITKQAANFSISETYREVGTGNITYSYKPAYNFVGTDVVEIKSARGSDGASPNDKIIFTTIHFTILP